MLCTTIFITYVIKRESSVRNSCSLLQILSLSLQLLSIEYCSLQSELPVLRDVFLGSIPEKKVTAFEGQFDDNDLIIGLLKNGLLS